MTEIKLIQSEDFTAWDEYVKQHDNATAYHRIAWMKAVEAGYKHKCFYWFARNSNGSVVGILPTVLIAPPFSKGSLCALPFCDIGGVLADNDNIKQMLIDECKRIALLQNVNSIEIRSRLVDSHSYEGTSSIENSNQKVSMLMPLPENSELLFSSFKSKLRSQIRKADKNGLTYKLGSEKRMLDDFYHVFAHNMRALGSPVHGKQWFLSLLEYYKNNMLISVVYKDEIPIGAGIVLTAGNKAAIPWASTKAEFNRLSPNMMLYWSLLKHLSDNGIKEFDFGRSSYGEGTFKFKQQWGAQPTPLNWQVINLQSTSQKTIAQNSGNSTLRAVVENIWRKLPINFTTFLGPKIRKYISL